MKDIPIGAKVECADGSCGKSVTIIVNPTTQKVTNLVVENKSLPHPNQRLVPFDQVVETTRNSIRLSCTQDELAAMDSFIKEQYIKSKGAPPAVSLYVSDGFVSDWYMPPYVTSTVETLVEVERIPPGEMAARRGMHVAATDGNVGKLGELIIDPDSEHITHLVLLEGHPWGKKEVTVPISAIDHVAEDTVYLKLDKQAVGALPTVPVKRHYGFGH